jgi:hypothetical protein
MICIYIYVTCLLFYTLYIIIFCICWKYKLCNINYVIKYVKYINANILINNYYGAKLNLDVLYKLERITIKKLIAMPCKTCTVHDTTTICDILMSIYDFIWYELCGSNFEKFIIIIL